MHDGLRLSLGDMGMSVSLIADLGNHRIHKIGLLRPATRGPFG
jgi:hypothetical protein